MSHPAVIHYDPDAPESAAARAAVRGPLLMLAAGHDRGVIEPSDVELFNMELNELVLNAQDDPELAVRYLTALVFAVDHGALDLAARTGRPSAAIVRHLLPDGCIHAHME